MKKARNFQILFKEARKSPEYWVEHAILEFTESVSRRMRSEEITRAELARRINRSPTYVTKMLRGATSFTLDSMVRVALAVGCEFHVRIKRKREQAV